MSASNTFFSILLLGALVVGGSFVIKEQQNAEVYSARFLALEHQVDVLLQILQESNAASESNKAQIQELANRKQVITKSQDELLTDAVAKASPAVVSIVISKDVPLLEVQYVNPFGNDPFYRDVGYEVPTYRQIGTQKRQVGAGTGFIIRKDGYLITNKHVAYDLEAQYVVLLSNGEQKIASIVYRDEVQDLAILKIDAGNYATLPLADAGPKLGQTVVAIGNALGEYSNSVSVGIISGLDRTIQAKDDQGEVQTLVGVIQTDAAINRGNSGGPLLDLSGAAVGVNVAIDSAANNIAFAIPINLVIEIVEKVLP